MAFSCVGFRNLACWLRLRRGGWVGRKRGKKVEKLGVEKFCRLDGEPELVGRKVTQEGRKNGSRVWGFGFATSALFCGQGLLCCAHVAVPWVPRLLLHDTGNG